MKEDKNTTNKFLAPNKILADVDTISTTLMIGKNDPDNNLRIEAEPFYAHFFTSLVKTVSKQIDTLAVGYNSGIISFYINAHFWHYVLKDVGHKVAGVKHEILHLVFKHIFRYRDFSNKTLFNVAADIVVNQYIRPELLIEGAVILDNFKELELDENQHVNYYYNKLQEFHNKVSKNPDCEESTFEAWANLKNFMSEDAENQKRHAFWKEVDKMTSAEKDIAEAGVNQALDNSLRRMKSKDYGNLPAGLQEYLEEFQKSMVPVVNWRRVLKLFTNSSSRTRIKNTLRRPSKRYGTNPGIKVKKNQKILVAIDTSGSIDMDDLKEFFSEIYHIWKQGAEVFVVECDVAIQNKYNYRGKTPTKVSGRGGTSFEAPIIFSNEEYQPDALIYFTDGYAPNPVIRSKAPVLWLLSKQGATVEEIKEFQGRKVKMI